MTDIERKLRTLERREPPELWEEIERRAEWSPVAGGPPRRWPAVAAALVVSAVSLAIVLDVFVRSAQPPVGDALDATRIDVGIDYLATEMDVGEGRVWMLTTDVDYGWVVASVDPVTLEGRRFPLGVGDGDGGPGDLAVGEDSVWVTYSPIRGGSYEREPGIVFRLDAATGEIVDQLTVGRSPWGIVVRDGVLWIAEQAENRVVRIDATTGEMLGSTQVDAPGRLLDAFGWMWVESSFGTTHVVRLDPSTGEVTGTVEGVHDMAVGLDALFVSDQTDNVVWELDPETLVRERTVTGLNGDIADVVAGDGQMWIGRWFEEPPPPDAEVIPGPLRYGEHRFYRVDPETFEPTGESVTTCPNAGRAAIAFGALWYPCLGDVFRVPLPQTTTETAAVFFPTWSSDGEVPLAGVRGLLVERDGCLFARAYGDDVLLLWEDDYTYDAGVIVDRSGQSVARVGDVIRGGGGYGSSWSHAESLTGTSIPERCRPHGVEPFAQIYDVERIDVRTPQASLDLGLGYPVCDVSRMQGNFGAGAGVAYVGTRMDGLGDCPTGPTAFRMLAVDVSGDGSVDGSFAPLACEPTCRTFAAPDIDGDGVDEIAVATGATGGSTLFELYAVAGTNVQRLRYDCVNCNQGIFAWGRPGGHAEGIYCPNGEVPGDFVVWNAEQTDDRTAYGVTESFVDVKGSFLVEVDRRDSQVPFEPSALPPGGGADFCGSPVG